MTVTQGSHFATRSTDLVAVSCGVCSVWFGIPRPMYDARQSDGGGFYCPNGDRVGWSETDADRLRRAEAKSRHLADQLQASEAEAERTRRVLAKERHRFASGVCPCCNRSFSNVRRHMESQHPDYDITRVEHDPNLGPVGKDFHCSCGFKSFSYRGLRTHQSKTSSGTHKTKV